MTETEALKLLLNQIMELECSYIERGSDKDHGLEVGRVAGLAEVVSTVFKIEEKKGE